MTRVEAVREWGDVFWSILARTATTAVIEYPEAFDVELEPFDSQSLYDAVLATISAVAWGSMTLLVDPHTHEVLGIGVREREEDPPEEVQREIVDVVLSKIEIIRQAMVQQLGIRSKRIRDHWIAQKN